VNYCIARLCATALWHPRYGRVVPSFVKRWWNQWILHRLETQTASFKSGLKQELIIQMTALCEQLIGSLIDAGKTDEEVMQYLDVVISTAPMEEGLKPFLSTGVIDLAKVREIWEEQLFLARHRRKHEQRSAPAISRR